MTVIGVHEYGLRSGTCFLACTVCEHSGVKSGVTGVQLPRVSSPRSHVLSQHMMCLYEFTELNFLSVGSQLPPRTLNILVV